MPSNANRQFLDFEKPIKDLIETIEKYKHDAEKNKMDMTEPIRQLEESIAQKRKEITQHLTSWQRVQLSRHPDRPYTQKYIEKMTKCFLELYGDRNVKDDKAMIGGFANLEGETVMIIGQQKGINTKMRQMRNFGMANPEGYRKALRLMQLGEKFGMPVISLIDTPGAFPGIGSEERHIAEAIAVNLRGMMRLRVPIIAAVIGEGGSGGALGIGVADRVLILESAYYSVISPEACSAILWRDRRHAAEAAEALKLTAQDLLKLEVVDEIVPEPEGGAHRDYDSVAENLGSALRGNLQHISKTPIDELVEKRYEKFRRLGIFTQDKTTTASARS